MNFKDELKQFVETNSKLVQLKSTSNPELFVLKYKKCVFYDALWTKELEECRGTIVDSEYNIISYPFSKIYNYGIEKFCPEFNEDEYVTALNKINGFMIAVTWYNDDILISTTGSIDSTFVDYAKELIEPNINHFRRICKDYKNFTFMFECVHRSDPHIIEEKEGLYFLGYRENIFNSPIITNDMSGHFGVNSVDHYLMKLSALKELVKHVKHEGFVFYQGNKAAKMKSPFYLVNKFIARTKKLNLFFGKNYKSNLDEEFYGLAEMLQSKYTESEFSEFTQQERLDIIKKYYE